MRERALVYDPQGELETVFSFLKNQSWEAHRSHHKEEFLSEASEGVYSLLLFRLDQPTDLEFVRQLWIRLRSNTRLLIVGPNDVTVAVAAMQSGAHHYWPAPLDFSSFENAFRNGLLSANLHRLGYNREGTLLQIIKEVALTMELDGLTNILVDSAIELTNADGGAILLFDEKSGFLTPRAMRGARGEDPEKDLFSLTQQDLLKILEDRSPVHLNLQRHESAPHRMLNSLIIAPIHWKEEPLAELVISKYAGSEPFTAVDLKVIALLTEEISAAVYNAITHYKTKELTIKDDLTDAYNRRYFEQYLDEEFFRAKRYGSNLSMIFFDVDNLKEVNVKYGHLTGSRTLQEIAHRIILTVRGIDKVVRYGGDEFCVVLPETETHGAYQVAERIRNIIASKPFRINEHIQVTLTGSIGIASFPAHANSKEELVRQADRAMFSIKNGSKNTIGIAQSP